MMHKRQNYSRIKIFANIFFFIDTLILYGLNITKLHCYYRPLEAYRTESEDTIFAIKYFVLHKQPTLSLHLAAILIKFTMKAALI